MSDEKKWPEPGPELDALVAEKVMGWHRQLEPYSEFWKDDEGKDAARAVEGDDFYYQEPAWSPSTDLQDAWGVVERLVEQDCVVELKVEGRWGVQCWITEAEKTLFQEEPTAPAAICYAALEATR